MLNELIKQSKKLTESLIHEVHTALPGRIVGFDAAAGRAEVLPIGKYKKPDGKLLDFPQIPGVPVVLIQGGAQTATIGYPIKENDGCLLIIAEQALDSWLSGGAATAELRFDLTNAIAIPGLFVNANSVVKEACDTGAIIIDKDGKRITVTGSGIDINGDVSIAGNVRISGDIYTSSNIGADGRISAQNDIYAAGSISTNGGGISADGTMTVPKAVIEHSLIVDGIDMLEHTHISGEPGEETSPPLWEE